MPLSAFFSKHRNSDASVPTSPVDIDNLDKADRAIVLISDHTKYSEIIAHAAIDPRLDRGRVVQADLRIGKQRILSRQIVSKRSENDEVFITREAAARHAWYGSAVARR